MTAIRTGKDIIDRQYEMELIEWFVYHGLFSRGENGDCTAFRDMTENRKTLVGWDLRLDGKPMRLKMRPIQDQDEIIVKLFRSLWDEVLHQICQCSKNLI